MTQIDKYSMAVKWAKWILPFLALILMVSIFTLTKNDALRNGNILISKEVLELASGQKITNPHFSGVTDSGDAFLVAAKEALPDAPQPDQIDLVLPTLEVNTRKGIAFNSNSEKGALNIKSQRAELSGNVSFHTSNGYTAQSEKIEFNLRNGSALSKGQVYVEGPIGSITAGQFEAHQSSNSTRNKRNAVLKFSKGVRLIYLPSGSKSAK